MISFFKLAIGVVLLVMVMIWFCSYLRRGRHREPWLRPPSVTTPPPPYTVHGGSNASALGVGVGRHPSLISYPGCTAPPTTRATLAPATSFVGPPPDDLPPPYHTVVNMPPPPPPSNNNNFVPPPYQPSYDALGKTTTGPT